MHLAQHASIDRISRHRVDLISSVICINFVPQLLLQRFVSRSNAIVCGQASRRHPIGIRIHLSNLRLLDFLDPPDVSNTLPAMSNGTSVLAAIDWASSSQP